VACQQWIERVFRDKKYHDANAEEAAARTALARSGRTCAPPLQLQPLGSTQLDHRRQRTSGRVRNPPVSRSLRAGWPWWSWELRACRG
jgi:hypothetical protein